MCKSVGIGTICAVPSTKRSKTINFLFTTRRDLDATKHVFRKMLKDEPLLLLEKISTDTVHPAQG